MFDADVYMAKGEEVWRNGECVTITFCVTEDCNLRCTYCYMVGKNEFHVMSYETAKKIVDYVLKDEYICSEDAVVWDFIGGEPLLEIELIDKICDYIIAKMYATGHKWFNKYRFSFSSNGVLYQDEKVQAYFKKHEGHCSYSISLDGTKEKHDLSRKKKDGTGSYDDVIRNVPLWLHQFPGAGTKATFAHNDLPYLKDSIIHIWNTGLSVATANIVFEDVWEEGDDDIYEKQLVELADYVIENKLWDSVSTSFFNTTVGLPVTTETLNRNRCGAGYKTFAFDCNGDIFPCIRFLQMCFDSSKKLDVGNVETELDMNKLRSFISLDYQSQSPHECNQCDIGIGCGWCVAHNYEASNQDTIFERTIAICKMHKANARANQYFWKRYSEATGKTSPLTTAKANAVGSIGLQYVYFITADNITPHCSYHTNHQSGTVMSANILKQGLDYCTANQLVPVFLGKCEHGLNQEDNAYHELIGSGETDVPDGAIIIHDNKADHRQLGHGTAVLLASKETLGGLAEMAAQLFSQNSRVNVFIQDMLTWGEDEYNQYKTQLEFLAAYIESQYANGNNLQLNLLTDGFNRKATIDCSAGVNTVALAPDGKFYICPAFYFDGLGNIGDLEQGVNTDKRKFCRRDGSPLCKSCDVKTCNRCMYLNKTGTRELAVSPKMQCRVNHLQQAVTQKLKSTLVTQGLLESDEKTIYDDPFIDIYISNRGVLSCKV